MFSVMNSANMVDVNSPTVIESRSGFVIRKNVNFQTNLLLEKLLADPESLFQSGQAVDNGLFDMRREHMIITVAGINYFVKRYKSLGLRHRLKVLRKPSQALRSWRGGLALLKAKIPTPAPLLLLQRRWGGEAFLICCGLDNPMKLLELWPQLADYEKREVLVRLAELFGQMHNHHIYHGDLNWRNILVQRRDGKLFLSLVDLDGFRSAEHMTIEYAERDLKHFIPYLRCYGGTGLESLFMKCWRNSIGCAQKLGKQQTDAAHPLLVWHEKTF
ncbi:MAG: lipopolysaccharide kinase InaA family protein [Desulfuromonadaceae bacterium]|nr:lipopolysaccharide kinase InaA family protein [Desulfuromonadaceae bacterium]